MSIMSTMESNIKGDFNFARNHLENTPDIVDKATPETKLKLYGLYKQATVGDCKEDAPSIFNVKSKLKYDAWIAHKGLSPDAACESYTKAVQDLDPHLRLPSQKRRSSGLNGSSGSLSALVKSDSKDFLDRLLGAPPRLGSPAVSPIGADHSIMRKDEDTEEKSSTGSAQVINGPAVKKKFSLKIGANGSVDELRKMISEEPGSSSSSVNTSSAPATPQAGNAPSAGGSKMRKVSSLTWGKAENYAPLIDSRSHARRKSDGDDIDLGTAEDDDNSSNMEWDSDTGGDSRRKPNFYLNESDNESERQDDSDWEEDEDEDEDDEYGEAAMRRRRDDSMRDDSETLLGTMLFTMPFVVCLRIYQFLSSIVLFPITTLLHSVGVHVEKAPDNYSVREKKQAAAIAVFTSLLPLTPLVYMWTFFFLIFPFTTLPTAAYIAWMLYWDESPRNGSRFPMLRDVPLAKYFIEYFPITLSRRSAQLDPQKKYVFAYHPHGIIGLGSFGAFATHAAGFKEKFPGIDMRLLTLDSNFKVPIIREVLLGFGVCSCSRRSCDAILNRGPGSAICLVVGGAAESLETQRGTYRLILGRKGFVQVAVENDADLVPVIAFGETDAFETFSAKPGTLLREIQIFIQRKLKFTVPIFWGRGMFNMNFGLMPKRRPIHVVTGEPLSVKPFRDRGLEGEALIEAVHKAYIAALSRLFDENKDECEAGIKRKESLTILK